MASNSNSLVNAVRIVDIHARSKPASGSGSTIREQILSGLMQPVGHKTLPTLLLYDERGLHIYDEITTRATEYYLFPAEEEILKNKADEIVRLMHSGVADPGSGPIDEFVVELGAGALRKTSLILNAFARLVPNTSPTPPINYLALDLEKRELERTLMELNASDVGAQLKGRVATVGLCGTYHDGLRFIEEGGLGVKDCTLAFEGADAPFASERSVERVGRATSSIPTASRSSSSRSRTDFEESEATRPRSPISQPPLHILFIGSSLGNFARGDDAAFLKSLPLRPGSDDTLLLGLDHGHDAEQIKAAYNDSQGISKKFAMNGLANAGRALGDEDLFDKSKWEYVGIYNRELRRHEAYYKSTLVFRRFKSYVVENEERMERNLRRIKYYLDAANTLTIVAGEGRPEKYVLPLMFLLMRRALWIIGQAASVTLAAQELEVISSSLDTLSDAVYDRVRTLQAMYKLQNQNEKDQFKKFFYGLYRYVCEEAKPGANWQRSPSLDAFQINEDIIVAPGENDDSEEPVRLFFTPRKEDLLLLLEDSTSGLGLGRSEHASEASV